MKKTTEALVREPHALIDARGPPKANWETTCGPWHSMSNGHSILQHSSRETNYQGDISYETDMAWPFRILHRGEQGQDFHRSVPIR
jgi:hypothetical protein